MFASKLIQLNDINKSLLRDELTSTYKDITNLKMSDMRAVYKTLIKIENDMTDIEICNLYFPTYGITVGQFAVAQVIKRQIVNCHVNHSSGFPFHQKNP
jgi:hypothetical protein